MVSAPAMAGHIGGSEQVLVVALGQLNTDVQPIAMRVKLHRQDAPALAGATASTGWRR